MASKIIERAIEGAMKLHNTRTLALDHVRYLALRPTADRFPETHRMRCVDCGKEIIPTEFLQP